VIEPFLTKKDLARKMKVSERTIQRIDPPCVRVGGQNRYLWSEVLTFLRGPQPQEAKVIPFPTDKGAA
jgi:hypothetical protein